jgi:alcohol dehydrogenase class IV
MSLFKIPEYIFIGKNALIEAKEKIVECGTHACIITGKHIVKSEMMKQLKDVLIESKIQFDVFDGITGEPTNQMIKEGKTLFLEKNCDFLIGIGGGSPLDSAKAIALMIDYDGEISDFSGKVIDMKLHPIVAIPTTAGTGSEATKYSVITDVKTDVKMLLKGDCLLPKVAIVDEEFTLSAPKSITASTGLDALTHAIEAYTSKVASPLTDDIAISSVKRIMKYLSKAYVNTNDIKARKEMAIAALEAGICINNSSVTLVHGLSRPIGALFHIPHGLSNAMLLNKSLSFALDGAYDRFATLGREIGVATEQDSEKIASENFLIAVINLCNICDVPTLKEYGIDREEFINSIDKMAQDAIASGSPVNTRKKVEVADCKMIYYQLFV